MYWVDLFGLVFSCGATLYILYTERSSENPTKFRILFPIVRKLVYVYTKQRSRIIKNKFGPFSCEEMADKMALAPI